MSKKQSMLIASIPPIENMVSQIYDATRLKLFTQGQHMRAGETRPFNITMVEDYEYFEGHEIVHQRWSRNPKLFQGEYINVHQGKDGSYYVTLRNLEMGDDFNAVRIGNAITTELLTAKKVLGL